jgi:hypothetical protein
MRWPRRCGVCTGRILRRLSIVSALGREQDLQLQGDEPERCNVALLKSAHRSATREALGMVKGDPNEAMQWLDGIGGIHEDLGTR